jgi:hypothetical protein
MKELLRGVLATLTPEKEFLVVNEQEAGWPQSWSRCFGEEKNSIPLPRTKIQFLSHPAHDLLNGANLAPRGQGL